MKPTIVLAIILSSLLLWGCAPKEPAPNVSVNVFKDRVYPCVSVTFTDMIEYKGRQDLRSDNDTYTVYSLAMNTKPYYDIKVAKRYSENFDWTLEPVSEQYDATMKIYEISGSDDYFDRSAAAVLLEKNGDLYLRGIVGEYTRPDTVYYISLDRLVQKSAYLHLFSLEGWQNSSAGKRIIRDMKEQIDWLFENTEVIDCGFGERIDQGVF